MSSAPRIRYTPRPDTTAEGESNALAAVYRFILNSHEHKKAAPESRPDAMKGSNDDRARTIISNG